MKKRIILLCTLVSMLCTGMAREYKAEWDDLNEYPQAQWLNDVKFGMYWHWNMNSIPGTTGWYGQHVYNKKSLAYKYQTEHYGNPAVFGYKDLNKYFTAEKFDASEWVGNAKKIGAKFVVGMAVHHDGFDMYDSSYTEWNSVDKNPHIDVIGELEREARKQGLKFGATSHLAFNWEFFSRTMYNNPDTDAASAPEFYNVHKLPGQPKPEFVEQWYNRTKELISKYNLDFLWFDFGTREPAYSDKYTAKITSYFYNHGERQNKEVAMAAKLGFFNNKSLIYDIENGKFPYPRKTVWMADCTMNNKWFNLRGKENPYILTGKYWLYQLIDIVSKNGTLLLNMGPNADGSWMEPWRDELFKMGEWLDQYGEAIYNTKPWHRFGEGDNFGGDSFTHVLGDNLTSNDIRFTRKGDTLYAIVCGWRTVPVRIKALNSKDLKGLNVKSVELMGHKGGVKWQQNAEDLMVTFPEEKFGDYAYVLKIKGDNMFPEREEYVEMEIPFGADSLKNVSQVRVVAKGSNKQMAVAEIAVVADTKPTKLHNITTLSGELFSSSVEDGMVAERAGDNNMCGNVYAGSVAMTKSSKDPYIGVKFQQPKSLFGVIVYPEMNSREKMMREASLQCLDASGKVIYDKPFKGIVADPATKVIIP